MNTESFVRLQELEQGYYSLVLDFAGAPLNVLSQNASHALGEVLTQLPLDQIRGLVISSAKRGFVAGADITEFCATFASGKQAVYDYAMSVHAILNTIEDLPFPTVCAIRGDALGGGFELALSTDFRVVSDNAKLGLPEVSLGIMPGWAGSVRLPRLIGLDNALQWILQARPFKAAEALRVHAADALVADAMLEDAALQLIKRAASGEIDYRKKRAMKTQPLGISQGELEMATSAGLGLFGGQNPAHYPAPSKAVESLKATVNLEREAAQERECRDFVDLTSTPTARSLINLFMSDREVRRDNKNYAGDGKAPKQAAVLGAGIMGGGVAYQTASTGTPILMKDINSAAIDAGLAEADRLMIGQLKRGRMKPEQALKTTRLIQPRLDYYGFDKVEFVVEAVVENIAVKRAVLADVEQQVAEDCVLATNTSTLTVAEMEDAVTRPQNLCGMHFFNPVHLMPLVEVIKGEKTSDEAIAKAVNYALSMRKLPVVVKDCSGFLVNRILFAYIRAFAVLVNQGIDFVRIDKLMEKFGWPMGPATLADMVGMDTSVHASAIVGKAYPDRMSDVHNATHILLEAGRLGQKSGAGFYRYELDKRGKQKKLPDPAVSELLAPLVTDPVELTDQQIVERLMLPFCFEAVRCLEQKVAESVATIDIALVSGVGFPRHLGGIFGYMDQIGAEQLLALSSTYESLGEAYAAPDTIRQMAESGDSFYAFSSPVIK
ncbi:fatty acid oxidation complex subunit alpha FadB [Alteromonas lipolytica]|uniref:enoyl-CoA hydratase n=1 Tax=Alteromonas lipolytica TaxID=1856405 RepID=A0A1E8FC63_9ALTE|nr:fatty acid oxidation complex subunit alpha FadB [Alteromonas lipolytica]OFI33514.1 multifunctional fatty acid oxidation complex subunit alpha [Alteromonas lipolytica]GGF58995.1 fatty acid oxidation complex subunit alpha [Alteromonas lipolytica]